MLHKENRAEEAISGQTGFGENSRQSRNIYMVFFVSLSLSLCDGVESRLVLVGLNGGPTELLELSELLVAVDGRVRARECGRDQVLDRLLDVDVRRLLEGNPKQVVGSWHFVSLSFTFLYWSRKI